MSETTTTGWRTISVNPNLELDERDSTLPVWFMDRMMTDYWVFGLLLVTGQVLVVHHIDAIHTGPHGEMFADVDLHDDTSSWGNLPHLGSPTSRSKATVNLRHVVCAVELADT